MLNLSENKFKGPFRGNDLTKELVNTFPNTGGVYLWRRVTLPDPTAILNSDQFKKWIDKSISIPFFRSKNICLTDVTKINGLSVRNNFINFSSIEIGGGEITTKKNDDLEAMTTTHERSILMDMIDKASVQFGPVLYVGEAVSIRKRVFQHILEKSPFRCRLQEHGSDINETALNFISLPNASENERQVIEQILTYLFISPLSFRAG
jgi:hypothetical protein